MHLDFERFKLIALRTCLSDLELLLFFTLHDQSIQLGYLRTLLKNGLLPYVFCGADGDPDFFVTLTVWRLILTSVYFSHIHVYVYIYNTFLHTLIYIYTYSHCEGHGQCNCGRCDCKVGWYGKKCEHPRSCPLSTEESIRKCQGSATLPCSGRGK